MGAAAASARTPNTGLSLIEMAQQDLSAPALSLVKAGAPVDVADEVGGTALSWAVIHQDEPLIRALLKRKANPNKLDASGVGPLALATEMGSTAQIEMLLKAGADPNLARQSGETDLMTAARRGSTADVELLLAHGARVDPSEERFGQTALMWAAAHPDVVALLLKRGADTAARTKSWEVEYPRYLPMNTGLNENSNEWAHEGSYRVKAGGLTPIFFAIQEDSLESVRLLVEAGADINTQSADGTSPLLASLYKWALVAVEAEAPSVFSPTQMPFVYRANLPIAEYLLQKGAKLQSDGSGYSPLHAILLQLVLGSPHGSERLAFNPAGSGAQAPSLAASPPEAEKIVELIRKMLAMGPDLNGKTQLPTRGPVNFVRVNPIPVGSTPLHLAVASGRLDVIEMLLDAGARPDVVREDGHSPLSVAVMADDVPAVKLLVKRGANLATTYNTTDQLAGSDDVTKSKLRTQQSLLHIAAASGATAVIPVLVAEGVNPGALNGQGETALQIAQVQEQYRYERLKRFKKQADATPPIQDHSTSQLLKSLSSSGMVARKQIRVSAR